MKRLFENNPVTDRKAFNRVLVSVLLAVLHQTYHTFYSNIIGILLSVVVLFYGFWGWMTYYKIHRLNPWERSFLILIIYFFLVGFLHGGGMSNSIIGLMLSQDIRYVMFFLIGGMFAFGGNMKSFHQIMKILGVISIIFGILALLTFNPTVQKIDTREGTWSISYYYWWCSSACFYYWGYYVMFEKKDQVIGYGVMIAYVVLGLLFLKRSAVVEFAVVLAFYTIFAPKKRGYLKPIILVLLGFVVIMVMRGSFVKTLYDLMMGRFGVAMEEFDRAIEADSYFASANTIDLIFGNGIGHYYDSFGIKEAERTLNALHLGWANIIYKGGVFYALFMIILYLSVIKRVFLLPKDNYGKVCLGVAISSLASLFYAGGWTYTIIPFCISAPIFYTVAHTSHRNNNFDVQS